MTSGQINPLREVHKDATAGSLPFYVEWKLEGILESEVSQVGNCVCLQALFCLVLKETIANLWCRNS